MKKSNKFKITFYALLVATIFFAVDIFFAEHLKNNALGGFCLLAAIGCGIGAFYARKAWKNNQGGVELTIETSINFKLDNLTNMVNSCKNNLKYIENNLKLIKDEKSAQEIEDKYKDILSRQQQADKTYNEIDVDNVAADKEKLAACAAEYADINSDLRDLAEKIKVSIFDVQFIIPEGYHVEAFEERTTRARGTYYQDLHDYDIYEKEPVGIFHKPSKRFPENTDIVALEDNLLLGHLKQDMAEDFVKMYGQNFRLRGYILRYDLAADEENFEEEDLDEDKVTTIIIAYDKPVFKKDKTK